MPSAWEGVVVIPSSKAYEPPKETENGSAAASGSGDSEMSATGPDGTESSGVKAEQMEQIAEPAV